MVLPAASRSFLDLISPDFAVLQGPPDPVRRDPVLARRELLGLRAARHGRLARPLRAGRGRSRRPSSRSTRATTGRATSGTPSSAGLDPVVSWAWRAERSIEPGAPLHRYGTALLLDPYARAVAGAAEWGAPPTPGRGDAVGGSPGATRRRPREGVRLGIRPADRPAPRRLASSTRSTSGASRGTRRRGVAHPGTFRGLVEKIPYLVDLGVTAVELMPVTEFEENDNDRRNPVTGERLKNLWGYHPISFFAPRSAYARERASRERSSTSSRRW